MEHQVKRAHTDGIILGVAISTLVLAAILTTWGVTEINMHREAVANGCGHWTIVNGTVEFAWGAPQDF